MDPMEAMYQAEAETGSINYREIAGRHSVVSL